MDAKLGLLLGLGAGMVLGAGGMYATIGSAPAPEVVENTVVVTQIVEHAIAMASPREREVPAAEAAQLLPPVEEPAPTIAFQAGGPPAPGDTPPGERRNRTEEEWRTEWTQRQARFMAEWTNRTASARTNFIASAKLSEDQATRFDVLVASMNVRLAAVLDPMMAKFQQGIRPTPEERVKLMHDVSGALVTTYDEMNRAMPEDWSNVATSNNVSLSQFVDPKYLPFMRGMSGGRDGGPGSWGGRRGGGPPTAQPPTGAQPAAPR